MSKALTECFQYHHKLVNGFWKCWHAEYVKSLTPLRRLYKTGHEIHKGDLVLVSEDRIAQGRNGHVWSVTLGTSPGSLTRHPAQWLHLFEACDADLDAELT